MIPGARRRHGLHSDLEELSMRSLDTVPLAVTGSCSLAGSVGCDLVAATAEPPCAVL